MAKLSLSLLDRIEKLGNKLPNPTVLFIYLSGLVILASWLSSMMSISATHPTSGELLSPVNLVSTAGLQRILTEAVSNFVGFAPVGTVLVAILGIGIAEHSGLLAAALKASIMRAPKQLLTFSVILCGVLSSIAADTGYVVLIPLAAIMFSHAGRNPLTGIAATFAGVSGGYSANLVIGPVDAILSGITTEAAGLIESHSVSAAGNYYFIAASTLLIAVICTLVTELLVAKRLDPETDPDATSNQSALSVSESAGLKAAGLFTFVFVALLLWATVPESGLLRDPNTGSLTKSPLIKGIVPLISLYAAIAGIVYGKISGRYLKKSEAIAGMEQQMATMASYLVLMFFAAQFVAYFQWSNLGAIVAIGGAQLIQSANLPVPILLCGFIFLASFINLFIGSASAKWALIAPVFVPMLMLSGVSPEATQMAYRIGDSSTNIITPLMPYFGVVIAFAQKYRHDLGIGTLIALMLPYSIALLLGWTAMLLCWTLLELPLGPGASIYY